MRKKKNRHRPSTPARPRCHNRPPTVYNFRVLHSGQILWCRRTAMAMLAPRKEKVVRCRYPWIFTQVAGRPRSNRIGAAPLVSFTLSTIKISREHQHKGARLCSACRPNAYTVALEDTSRYSRVRVLRQFRARRLVPPVPVAERFCCFLSLIPPASLRVEKAYLYTSKRSEASAGARKRAGHNQKAQSDAFDGTLGALSHWESGSLICAHGGHGSSDLEAFDLSCRASTMPLRFRPEV